MSLHSIEAHEWDQVSMRAALRRAALLLILATVIVGPVLLGGAVGWIMSREAGPTLGDDGWVRSRPALANSGVGLPLISSKELEAAGLSLDEARKILRR